MLENEDFLKILEHAFGTSQETVRTLQERNNSELSEVESLNIDLAMRQETSLKQFEGCAEKTKHLRVEIEEKQRMVDALASNNEQLKSICEDQTIFNSKLQEELQASIKHNKEILAASEMTQNQSNEEISGARRVIGFCEKYLGLQILLLKEKIIQFRFKNMIPEKPDTVAYINLTLSDQNDYNILETYPALTELKKMEDVLNQTNNLSGFIQCSRRLLKNEWLKSI